MPRGGCVGSCRELWTGSRKIDLVSGGHLYQDSCNFRVDGTM